MQDIRLNPPTSEPRESATDRREFLSGLGMAACLGAVALDATAEPASAQVAQKPKGPAPSAGIEGIKLLLARKEPVAWVFTGDSITHGAQHTKGWRSYPEHF